MENVHFFKFTFSTFPGQDQIYIPEMRRKCDLFQAFLDAFSIYLGAQVVEFDEEERWKTKKEALTMSRHIMRENRFAESA